MINVSDEQLADALNEWMRRYTETPEQFEWEWQTVSKFFAERSAGEKLNYGARVLAYLETILVDLRHLSTCCHEVTAPLAPPRPRNEDTCDRDATGVEGMKGMI